MSRIIKYFFSLLIFASCIPDKEKSRVVIVWKKHLKAESGDGATFENEKWLLYIERVNGTNFSFYGKTKILQVNRDSYEKLKTGNILENKY